MAKGNDGIYKQKKSPFWWVSYYRNGKQVRESSKQTSWKAAQKYRAERISSDKVPDKRSVATLLDGLVADYENNHRKGVDWCRTVVNVHLKPHFGKMRSETISKDVVQDYMAMRRKAGRKNATINREIALLRRSFTLADADFPRITKLAEKNVREGFVTPEQYYQLLNHMPEHIKPILQFAYRTGCRRGEILNLKWSSVDLANGSVRLVDTKNGEARTVVLSEDLKATFDALSRNGSEYVFTYRGKPLTSIKSAWKSGCEAAKLPDILFHDLRRTAIRNLLRAGVSHHVVMGISGHKTRSVFDRYNIVSEDDKKEAMVKLEAAQATIEKQAENMMPSAMDRFMVPVDGVELPKKARKKRKKALDGIQNG